MNPVEAKIHKYLDSTPVELAALKHCCARYMRFCSAVDTDGSIMIAHRPWVAPLNYLITLYPGAKSAWFGKYRDLHGLNIPPVLRPLLTFSNGIFAFGMSIYGMPPSMLKNPPVLDRSRLQCHDIATANELWKREFRVPADSFHFGSRYYTVSENTGYFLVGRKQVVSILPSGKTVGEWSDVSLFLRDELKASEELECSSISQDWWH